MDTLSNILFHAHSGLRYLVLLAGILSFLYSLVAGLRGRPWNGVARWLLVLFIALIDLQVVLGLVLVLVRPFFPALLGHIFMMVLAAAAAHVASVVNKRRPRERRSQMTAALGAAGALILIIGGITAIGRPIV